MTDPVVRLEPAAVAVEPGGQARAVVTVRNVGSIVEGYHLDVLAEDPHVGPTQWAMVQPSEVRVYPKQEGTATVIFSPPSDRRAAGGSFAFAVRVQSTIDPDVSAVAEGDVEVGRVFGLQAKIVPVTSRGRWRGRHRVTYTNWGNAPVRLRVTATDPDEKLGLLVRPDDIEVPLGGTSVVQVNVRNRHPFLRGSPTRLPFQVKAEPVGEPPSVGLPLPGDPRRPVVDAAIEQRPVVSRATVAVAGLGVLAVAGALAFALKSPATPQTYESEGAPSTPRQVVATAQPNGTVRVSWAPVNDIESYKLISLLGKLPGVVTKIPAESQVFVPAQHSFSTQYCFQLKAVRGKYESAPSIPTCAKTVKAPAVPPSTGASGSGASSGASAGAAGTNSTTGASNSSASTDASSGATSSGATSSGATSSGATSSGATSSSATSSGATNSASAAPNPLPPYGPNDYVILLTSHPGAATNATAKAAATADQLKYENQGGVTVWVTHTSVYPKMTLGGSPVPGQAWIVISAPESLSDSQQWCMYYQLPSCILLRPNPPS